MLERLTQDLARFLPTVITVALVLMLLLGVQRVLLMRRRRQTGEHQLAHQLIMLGLTGLGIFVVSLTLPVGEETRGQLVRLLGLILSGVIALSSTTFVSNAMAGLMLRAVRSFKPGDFVRVGEAFGRVTERGLFHTEIQTEDRDLTTLPNLYLVTNPITVVRASGTIVSATLSLGYDVEHRQVEPLLLEAASAAELSEPFVQVLDLGDYAITYRVAGFLGEAKLLLASRSRLRKRMLDVLHEAGVEIASPTLMDQRRLAEGEPILPPPEPGRATRSRWVEPEHEPHAMIFDKAERVEQLALMREEQLLLAEQLAEAEKLARKASTADKDEAELRLARLRQRRDVLAAALEAAAREIEDEG